MHATLLFFTLTIGCTGSTSPAVSSTQATSLASITLNVQSMTCESCEVTIRVAAQKLDGVESVEVSLDTRSATVRYDPTKITADAIANAITDLGYPASVQDG